MVPLAKRVAAALGRELLAEFRTTRDRGARLRFDASEVRALREVELGALRTAGQVFASGVVSDHDALRLAGFATPASEPRFAGEAVSPPDAQPLEAPGDAELRDFFERGE